MHPVCRVATAIKLVKVNCPPFLRNFMTSEVRNSGSNYPKVSFFLWLSRFIFSIIMASIYRVYTSHCSTNKGDDKASYL